MNEVRSTDTRRFPEGIGCAQAFARLRRHAVRWATSGLHAAMGAALVSSGCSGLLPKSTVVTESPWQTYKEAQEVFDRIQPYKTTSADLKELSLDPGANPNITLLNYSDVLRRFIPSPSISASDLDVGVRECIQAKTVCRGYEVDQKLLKRERNGGFWADFLNFRRKVDIHGWRFNGVILLKGDLVVYKLTGGQPSIKETEDNRTPLGPFQGFGESRLPRL